MILLIWCPERGNAHAFCVRTPRACRRVTCEGLAFVTPMVVGVVMGSASDWPTMSKAVDVLTEFGVAHEARW